MIYKIYNVLSSYKLTIFLLFLLAAGAAVGTFIENDFGTSTARVLVYNHIWYESVLIITTINLLAIIYQRKMWRRPSVFLFHFSFAVMLIGAGLTRYIGFEGIMHIKEGKSENRMISLEPYLQVTINHKNKTYYKEYQFELSALGNDLEYNIAFDNEILNIKYSDYVYAKKEDAEMGILKANVSLYGETKLVKLVGKRGMKGFGNNLTFKDTNVFIEYGSKTIYLPFEIYLEDFQLDRYPGSNSPSSYSSDVILYDKNANERFKYKIYMNHILQYGNYHFFQSSYDKDEKGTILSVNNDVGKWPTYLGYFMLALGLILNFFDKKSRFTKLTQYIKSSHLAVMLLIFSSPYTSLIAAESKSDYEYINEYKDASKKVAKEFSKIVIQDSMGRMKPVDSLNREILLKLAGKRDFRGMDANQIVLGMMTRPEVWRKIQMIKVKHPKVRKILNIDESRKYISFSEAFADDKYILKDYTEEASTRNPVNRNTFEKNLIKLDERLNIAYMVYFANVFRIFPDMNADPDGNNTKWFNPLDAINTFKGENKDNVEYMIRGFVNTVIDKNYDEAIKFLKLIKQYQQTVGINEIPSPSIVENEILFNELGLFFRLTIAYIIVGLIILAISLISVFNKKFLNKRVNLAFVVVLSSLFAVHTFGMGHRWYISGHAPWSDTYETLIYIAYSSMFAGLVFFRRSNLALSATVIMTSIFMFTAHLSGIDPQITNLVPVLKSYWLTIHVSIITGSYGFFGVGAMLGLTSLILFIFRKYGKDVDKNIYHITAITETSLIIGLAMLSVGNFLGGVWANESWGRYWGWDPKETWAWVSIIVYVIVLHLRFIPKVNTPYIFAVFSTLAFSSILMTYFGVNFYLSGLHSYATGDPVPIPTWVYVLVSIVFTIILLAYRQRDLKRLNISVK